MHGEARVRRDMEVWRRGRVLVSEGEEAVKRADALYTQVRGATACIAAHVVHGKGACVT
jgi:hypothetical protein